MKYKEFLQNYFEHLFQYVFASTPLVFQTMKNTTAFDFLTSKLNLEIIRQKDIIFDIPEIRKISYRDGCLYVFERRNDIAIVNLLILRLFSSYLDGLDYVVDLLWDHLNKIRLGVALVRKKISNFEMLMSTLEEFYNLVDDYSSLLKYEKTNLRKYQRKINTLADRIEPLYPTVARGIRKLWRKYEKVLKDIEEFKRLEDEIKSEILIRVDAIKCFLSEREELEIEPYLEIKSPFLVETKIRGGIKFRKAKF